ncbi:MAG: DUF2179 domain-containing protein [Candidatus Eisenbacteria bacterium]|nr:DUF2179 domain-containing protein [Candidatus Eisenbacteria bacterium]
MDWTVLLTGVIVFFARVGDVSLGTIRTISIVQGKTRAAFFLGFVEVCLWLFVVTTVVNQVMEQPILALFYALGFSTGNVVGIKLERRLAFGHTVLRVITPHMGKEMAAEIREIGFPVTTFTGEGRSGPITELYVACRRRDLPVILPVVHRIDPDAFYLTEQAGTVSKIRRPILTPRTGWRGIGKRK